MRLRLEVHYSLQVPHFQEPYISLIVHSITNVYFVDLFAEIVLLRIALSQLGSTKFLGAQFLRFRLISENCMQKLRASDIWS